MWILLCGSAALLSAVGAEVNVSYNQQEAVVYAQFARVAFCQEAAIESWSCGEMCNGTLTVPRNVSFIAPGKRWQVQGFIAELAENTCVLSFRGSITAMNWAADAQAISRSWPPETRNISWCSDCRVHSGFAAAYEELRPQVLAGLAKLRCNSLAIAGHSLGAAVATLAAAELHAEGSIEVSKLFTYGSPRVGNPSFVEAFTRISAVRGLSPPQWRVVHNNDPVPRISPTVKSKFLDYQHTSEEVYYNEPSSAFRICDSTPSGGENPECAAGTPIWKWINFDHLTYLNLTFAHRQMPPECVGANSGVQSADVVV